MSYKVLVVDDSSFFRRRVTEILNKDPHLEVIDTAVDGQEAVDKAIALKPDVITMDIEMPVLNGISAVKAIMDKAPTAIIMFSSLTHDGAKATLDALEAGALDFLPKKFSEIAQNTDEAGSLLRQRVVQIARKPIQSRQGLSSSRTTNKTPVIQRSSTAKLSAEKTNDVTSSKRSSRLNKASSKNYKLLAIGSSTGGPVALQKVLTELPENFSLPIILIQHMPASFTQAFASRLNSLCKISVKEARDGDILKPGCAYLAPGGCQMIISGKENAAKIKVIDDNTAKITFKPSVDVSFGSAAKIFGSNVLGVVLTGMGTDGREGARMLKSKGATIWAQDEESCVVYGMPQAVCAAGISQLSVALDELASSILKETSHG
ncbi:MAG: chemotaxis response regulator protein-glutamate methylesterase [Litorilituus sp.]|jgi:two-component system chemotaxis response regulator CheB|nr:chemotaxis response regulator protein-glutamate methylesterase [Litorilituus sp.]